MNNLQYILIVTMVSILVACSKDKTDESIDNNPITDISSNHSIQSIQEVKPEMTYEKCLSENTFQGEISFSSKVLCDGYKK